jgi:hypothetical protein
MKTCNEAANELLQAAGATCLDMSGGTFQATATSLTSTSACTGINLVIDIRGRSKCGAYHRKI